MRTPKQLAEDYLAEQKTPWTGTPRQVRSLSIWVNTYGRPGDMPKVTKHVIRMQLAAL